MGSVRTNRNGTTSHWFDFKAPRVAKPKPHKALKPGHGQRELFSGRRLIDRKRFVIELERRNAE